MSENAVMMGHGRKDLVKTCSPMKHTAAGHRGALDFVLCVLEWRKCMVVGNYTSRVRR